jgi:CRISPR-associated endonuclease Csn1
MGLHVGLDIGIASVGWCAVDTEAHEIVGIGVRVFEKAEDPKTGASLALPRRMARGARRRLRRRRARMQQLRDLMLASGMLSAEQLASLFVAKPGDPTPYDLRLDGLDRPLDACEWGRVLTQICKRRGYKSMRLGDAPDSDEGAVKNAIAANRELMINCGYRTAGEMLALDPRFQESKRNRGDYKGVISRELVLEEVSALFKAQRSFGNEWADEDVESEYVAILTSQAEIKEGQPLVDMVGVCSIDGVNKRIPVACPTFERFRINDKIHNIRYTVDGIPGRQSLSPGQRTAVVAKAFSKASAETIADVRKLCELPDSARFVGVRYDRNDPESLDAESKEKLPFPKHWHEMRRAVVAVSKADWDLLSADANLLDRTAWVLTYFKHDESVQRELRALGLDERVVSALSGLRFSGNGHLSLETTSAILPYMEEGLSYSDACSAAGLHHSRRPEGERFDRLPAIGSDDVRNPVVLRALSQSRKVLNAIIDTYGPPEELHIELGRDVARSYGDRRKIERQQKDSRAKNDAARQQMVELGCSNPRPLDHVKFKLWQEQGGRCAYSGVHIDPCRLLSGEPGVAEVDHILPHSRSFDDGHMNKVLVVTAENQRKRERTPYEYLGGDPARWHQFEELVASMHLPRPKVERLLKTDFDERAEDEFRERNLNDTRYLARHFKNFVEQNLRFSGAGKAPVLTVNGRATAYLRTGWQLQKVRSDGDLHHALDAAVIAVTSRGMVQAVSRFFSARTLRQTPEGVYVNPATGEIFDAKKVPEPWSGFTDQLRARLRSSINPLAEFEDPSIEIKPICVSRMPNHVIRGEVHKETVKRIEGKDDRGRTVTSKRIPLQALRLKDLERMVGRPHDHALYELLRARLESNADDPARAFAEPVFKPTRAGRAAPRVRAIRVFDDPSSGGTLVRGGMADNGAMVRTDVFEREGKYYLVPVYLRDVAAERLPSKAIIGGRPEADWREMDEEYQFKFSLFLNDMVLLEKRNGETWFGYFKGTDRSTGAVHIETHDGAVLKRGLGVATGIARFDKYHPDVLGQRLGLVRRERRLGLSHSSDHV